MSENELLYMRKSNKANLLYAWAVILLALAANVASNMPVHQLLFTIGLASSLTFLLTLLYFTNITPYVNKWLTIIGITLYSYYNLYAAHGNGTFRAIFLFFEALIVVALYLDRLTIITYASFIWITNILLYFFSYNYFFDPMDSLSFFHYNVAFIGCTILLIFITKWGKEMLEKSEERWQFALEGNGDGVWDWDIPKKAVYFSQQWKAMLGYKEHEIKNELSEWESRIHPEEKPWVMEAMNKHLRGETLYYATEHRILCKDGAYKWVLDRGKVMTRDKEGNPLRLVCSHTDITYRKQMEDALREERDRAQRYLDIAGVILLVLDAAQNVILINRKGCNILKYAETEIVGRNWFDNFVAPEVREQRRTLDDRILKGEIANGNGYYSEGYILTKNGEERIIGWQTVPMVDEQGKVKGTLHSGEDITERKRAQEQVEALQTQLIQKEKIASLAHLTAGVMHEINSPLGVIKSNISMSDMLISALNSSLSNPENTEQLAKAQNFVDKLSKSNQTNTQALERIIEVTKRLKKVSELDEADWQIFDLHEIIENALVMIQDDLDKRITIKKDYGKIGQIRCIPGQITQVVMNILLSRTQMFEGEGEITLTTAPGDGLVYLTISDTGKGIAKELQSRIFDPSFTTRGEVVGMELGLAIAYNIVQSHRGTLVFSSQETGGASFTITLPV